MAKPKKAKAPKKPKQSLKEKAKAAVQQIGEGLGEAFGKR